MKFVIIYKNKRIVYLKNYLKSKDNSEKLWILIKQNLMNFKKINSHLWNNYKSIQMQTDRISKELSSWTKKSPRKTDKSKKLPSSWKNSKEISKKWRKNIVNKLEIWLQIWKSRMINTIKSKFSLKDKQSIISQKNVSIWQIRKKKKNSKANISPNCNTTKEQ